MHEVPSLLEEYAIAVDTPFQTSPRLKTVAAQFVCRPILYCNDSNDDTDVDLEPPCFICHANVFSSDQNCSKDPNLQTSTSDSKSMLTKYIQIGPVLTVYRFRTETSLGFEPPHFIFYLTVFPWDSNCATETSLQTGPTI